MHSMIQVEVVIAAGKQIYVQVNREVNARRISRKDYVIDEVQPWNRTPSNHAISYGHQQKHVWRSGPP